MLQKEIIADLNLLKGGQAGGSSNVHFTGSQSFLLPLSMQIK